MGRPRRVQCVCRCRSSSECRHHNRCISTGWQWPSTSCSPKARTLSRHDLPHERRSGARGLCSDPLDCDGWRAGRRCDCAAVYTYAARRIWKCKACMHQFSVTSGTIFASRKLPIRDYLAAIAIFVTPCVREVVRRLEMISHFRRGGTEGCVGQLDGAPRGGSEAAGAAKRGPLAAVGQGRRDF